MKDKGERPSLAPIASSNCGPRDNDREMPSGSPMVATVRKELRSVAQGAATDIIDGFVGNSGRAKLKSNERS